MSDLNWQDLLQKEPEEPEAPTIQGVNLHDIGNSIRLAGAIYADDSNVYLCLLPGEGLLTEHARRGIVEAVDLPERDGNRVVGTDVRVLNMDLDEWNQFIRQTDHLETEVLTRSADGKLAKAILRKSQRQISTAVSWAVFKRDDYRCRYCGKDGIPLTVDHLVLWEEGGPSIEANLVTACRKCNKIRGNTQYADWLDHPHYRKMLVHLDPDVAAANRAVLATLDAIPRQHKRSR